MWLFNCITDFFKRITGNHHDSPNVDPNVDQTENQTENPTEVNMTKRALCVGINDYSGTNNDLNGCINDLNDWVNILTSKYGISDVVKLIDSQATKEAIKKNLTELIKRSSPGDLIVFTYSGHGSYVVDTSKDEPDSKDETLYTYNGNLLDDELRAIINRSQEGINIVVILDSCHSGTGTRLARLGYPKPRFMPPTDPEVIRIGASLPFSKAVLPESEMKEILFSGCKSTEYSYDANYDGVPNGAFTKTAIDALKKLNNPTYQELYDTIRKNLPSNSYPQTPQLEGSSANRSRKVFS
jgi:metacaspase-1